MAPCRRAAALLLCNGGSFGENRERGCKLPDAPSALTRRGSLCKLLLLLPATDAAPCSLTSTIIGLCAGHDSMW